MKNSLGDLNSYLFMQLDVLSNQDLKGEKLKEEVSRSRAITNIAQAIVENANVVLQAQKFKATAIDADYEVPKLLEG